MQYVNSMQYPIHFVLPYLAEKGRLNVCFWEIYWSLECSVDEIALLVHRFHVMEREVKKSVLEAEE